MNEILLWALTNSGFLHIILTEIERDHNFHESLITDDLLLADNEIDQLLLFLLPNSEHISQNSAHLLAG